MTKYSLYTYLHTCILLNLLCIPVCIAYNIHYTLYRRSGGSGAGQDRAKEL